jgi:hypothetical protein
VFGLISTIEGYTRDHYIKNYTSQLSQLDFEKDKVMVMALIQRLLDWYEENIDEIRSNQFVHNIREHEKSIRLLQKFINGE